MAGAARHDNAQPSVPFNVATAGEGTAFYGNRQPVPRRKTWPGKSGAVLGAAIYLYRKLFSLVLTATVAASQKAYLNRAFPRFDNR